MRLRLAAATSGLQRVHGCRFSQRLTAPSQWGLRNLQRSPWLRLNSIKRSQTRCRAEGQGEVDELVKKLGEANKHSGNHAQQVADGDKWSNAFPAMSLVPGRARLAKLAVPDAVAGHPAALLSVHLLGSVLVSFVAIKVADVLRHIAGKEEEGREQAKRGALPPLIAAVRLTIMAIHAPLRFFLVAHAFLHVASVLFKFLREYYTPREDSWTASVINFLAKGFTGGDILADKAFQVLAVIFVAWVALGLKDRWVQRLLDRRAENPKQQELSREMDQVMLPISSVISWLTVMASSALSLSLLGINLWPLATAGLGSGVVLGFASQSVLANVMAGCNLLLTRPFVVGDRITLKGAGDVKGVVERVDFTRTIIRDDDDVPVSTPNKVVTDAIIWNESRTELSPVREHYGGPRQLKLRLKLRWSDLPSIPDLTKDIKRHLITKCDGVDVMLPVYCAIVSAMEDQNVIVSITVSSTALAARSFMSFRQRVICDIGQIVRESDVNLAYNFEGLMTTQEA